MIRFLWAMRPYFRQVAGQLCLGSVAGIVMNTAVVLPAILLGRAIDTALALEWGTGTSADVTRAALLFVGGTLLTEVPRVAKRWWLMTANARIRANVRADAFRGVLAWPMADLQKTQDPAERQKLMQEHWTTMQSAMTLMQGTMGAGGHMMMGGGPMMMWQDYSKLTPEQLKQRQYMMDRWMPMQQMMMNHMMQQQSMMMGPRMMQPPAAPAPKQP